MSTETAGSRSAPSGVIDFPTGRYVYVGSALNSLIPRLGRHLRTARGEGRVAHWHIDYLLREPGVEIEAIYATDWAVRMECEIAEKVAEKGRSHPPLRLQRLLLREPPLQGKILRVRKRNRV